MAGFSTKGLYGVIATYYIYKHQGESSIKSAEIAQKMNLPQNYLEQILHILKKSGILKSIRGANGGYILGKKGSEITVLEIIETLEGEIFEPHLGDRECDLLSFWEERKSMVRKAFDVNLERLDEYSKSFGGRVDYII